MYATPWTWRVVSEFLMITCGRKGVGVEPTRDRRATSTGFEVRPPHRGSFPSVLAFAAPGLHGAGDRLAVGDRIGEPAGESGAYLADGEEAANGRLEGVVDDEGAVLVTGDGLGSQFARGIEAEHREDAGAGDLVRTGGPARLHRADAVGATDYRFDARLRQHGDGRRGFEARDRRGPGL